MRANYHTHTARCHHADGTPREYIEKAIKNGIKILGFSDHVPYPFSNGYHSGFRMEVSETEDYVTQIADLREQYKDKIEIHIGYEAEYYPKEFDRMLEQICQYECEYLLLGQHCLNNEYDGVPAGGPYADADLLKTYADQCIDGMRTGAFSYLAHPDLPNFKGAEADYIEQMNRICVAAKQLALPIELNVYGLWDGRVYPNDKFWRLAADIQNEVIIGCDAHWASFTGNPEAVEAAQKFLSRYGIRPTEDLTLRDPRIALKNRCNSACMSVCYKAARQSASIDK